jgi:hypothetical protein
MAAKVVAVVVAIAILIGITYNVVLRGQSANVAASFVSSRQSCWYAFQPPVCSFLLPALVRIDAACSSEV